METKPTRLRVVFEGGRRPSRGGLGHGSIPVAFSNGSGTFTIRNFDVPHFPGLSRLPGAVPIVGDFDGDGRDDIALTGVNGWATIPVAFSNGDGSFLVTNGQASLFAATASSPGVKLVGGDFNGDGRDDLAIVGASGALSSSVVAALGQATRGNFVVSAIGSSTTATLNGWSHHSGVVALSGRMSQ